ncbi:MAG: hypothetical protein Q8P80_03945 [Candidatus Levybacteria bacterium]|nr:hypothetical protein [Candidatus Levybacteria bacterium]
MIRSIESCTSCREEFLIGKYSNNLYSNNLSDKDNQDGCLEKINFKEYEGIGMKLMIPRINLFGTQRITEYNKRSRRILEAQLSKCGVNCLKDNPPIVCAISDLRCITLAVVDGNHRVRYSGNFRGIRAIPCLVYTPEQLAYIKNLNPKNGQESPYGLSRRILRDVSESLDSFSHSKMPDEKYQRLLEADNYDKLGEIFPSF